MKTVRVLDSITSATRAEEFTTYWMYVSFLKPLYYMYSLFLPAHSWLNWVRSTMANQFTNPVKDADLIGYNHVSPVK